MAADRDRHAAVGRLGVGTHAVEGDELAVETGVVGRPERPHHLDILLGAGGSPLPRHAEHLELLLEPTDADAELQATTREVVQGGDFLRIRHGVAFGKQGDTGREAEFGRGGGDEGQPNQRIGDRVVARPGHLAVGRVRVGRLVSLRVHDMLDRPDRVEPGCLGGLAEHGGAGSTGERAGVGVSDSELHGGLLVWGRRPCWSAEATDTKTAITQP